jgi:hypothetical protein
MKAPRIALVGALSAGQAMVSTDALDTTAAAASARHSRLVNVR